MDQLTQQRVYDIADRLREAADELDGGLDTGLDTDEVRLAVLDFLSLCDGDIPGDERWNNARTRLRKAIGQNT